MGLAPDAVAKTIILSLNWTSPSRRAYQLPPQALRNFDGRRFAVLEENGSQRRVDVEVGIETAERVEIETGLEEGQTVVGQ